MVEDKLVVKYTAQNVDDVESLMGKYPSELPNKYYHHSTNVYGLQPFDNREGEKLRLHIIGRLRNDVVDALVVENPNSINDIPHITLATAEGVKPVESNRQLDIHWEDVEPLDDYVDTTFRNNLVKKKTNNENINRLQQMVNIRRIIRESINKVINEGVNNQGYSHFAVNKATNKIVNGWDYKNEDPADLRTFKRDYFIEDMIDYELDPKEYKILTAKTLMRLGIDPDDDSNWADR